jgi:hypothetical protein
VRCQEPLFRHFLPILGTTKRACPIESCAEQACELSVVRPTPAAVVALIAVLDASPHQLLPPLAS